MHEGLLTLLLFALIGFLAYASVHFSFSTNMAIAGVLLLSAFIAPIIDMMMDD